jgi:hypothetical protein
MPIKTLSVAGFSPKFFQSWELPDSIVYGVVYTKSEEHPQTTRPHPTPRKEVNIMAEHKNEADYANANAPVAAGTASRHQINLANKAAQQAGSKGRAAKAAIEAAGKK